VIGDEIQALLRLLDRTEGFALAFVQCETPEEREHLFRDIDKVLAARGIKARDLRVGDSRFRLYESISSLAPPPQKGEILFVLGFENAVSAYEKQSSNITHLNRARELFRSLPSPIVFILPGYILNKIAREAPDFWDWRSGVFDSQRTETSSS